MALNSNFRTLTADNIEGVSADRNYLKSSFENGQLTGWTELSVALTSGLPTGTPTISSTAASSLALSATSVTPLSGSRSLLVDVPSALTAGHGFISDEFTIDRMDLGKVLTVTFDYERLTGTYNFSGTLGSQTWMVYIYDATLGAANWIQPAGYLGLNQSSGPGRVACTFQTSVTAGQKYRVAVIASQAASGASSIEFDNFTCSRQTAPIGPVVTDWVSYTPTGTWTTNTTYTGRWRRVGANGEYEVGITLSGAPNAATLTVALPSGQTIDTARLTNISRALPNASGSVGDASPTNNYKVTAFYDGPSSVLVTIDNASSTYSILNVVNNAVPITFASGDTITITFSVPISGWSSNVQLSNDTDTRVVDFRAYTTSARTVNNTAPTIIFENVDKDSHGAYNASTGVYTVPVSGDYVVSGQMRIGGLTMTAGAFFGFSASVDNVYSVRNHYTAFRAVTNSSAGNYAEGSGSVLLTNLSAGQTIRVKGWADVASSTFTDGANTFCIQRISGPSVVAASETVAARYTTVTGQSIPGTGANTLMTGWVKDYDTHSFFGSSGIATVPVSGKYEVSLCAFTNPTAYSTAQTAGAVLYKNGSQVSYIDQRYGNGTTQNLNVSGSDAIQCNAGDTLAVYFYSGGVATTINTTPGANHIVIKRVGN